MAVPHVNKLRLRRRLLIWVSGVGVLVVGLAVLIPIVLHRQYVAKEWALYQPLMGVTPISAPVSGSAIASAGSHTPGTPGTAPDFQLTSQTGQPVSLTALRGKTVVLTFLDPKCKDICPIISQEIVRADGLLKAHAADVAFVAVNVNQFHESQTDVAAFSNEQGLNKLSNWYFATGSTAQLQAVWKAYGITVQPNPTGDVVHSSFVYFINAKGQEAYISSPTDNKTSIQQWAQGINFVVRQLL